MTKRKRQDEAAANTPSILCDRKILVAVDFGTTFSGLAWVQTRRPEVQTPIIQWPDATSEALEGVTSNKVPTELLYDGQNYKWGFQIPEDAQRHQWFKLDLDPTQTRATDLATQYPDPIAAPPSYAFSAVRLSVDYLTSLRKHLEHVLSNKIPQDALRSTPIEYIITVPAVWSDMAQSKTRACAEKAGMGVGAALNIVSEPEAAAMYALKALDPHGIKIGDTFVLCDAGGGTVDLITYSVTALEPILKLKETSPGSGSLCGASFLNRRFQEYLEKKFGKELGWDVETLRDAMVFFEQSVKKQFSGRFGEEFFIPVSGLGNNAVLGVRRGKFVMSGTELRCIFEPVLNEVVRLFTQQIDSSTSLVSRVVLVGGFGENAYLRDSIRKEVRNRGIEVIQSPNAWTAVVRGALMKGLASTSPAFATVGISGRSARKHYGIALNDFAVGSGIDESHWYWDGYYGEHRVTTMDWFVKKGSTVEEDKPLCLDYRRKKAKSEGRLDDITCQIYMSSDPNNTGAPEYQDTGSYTKLVAVTADLSRIPSSRMPLVKGADEKMYYKIDYQIQITFFSAYTTYELIHDGVNYGQVKAEYV